MADNWLRERRIGAGLTQSQLAERAGVSLRALRNAELGSVVRSRSETTRRLLAVLGEDEAVRIGVLGPLTLRSGDTPVELGAAKQRWLLGLLALQPNQVVRRAEIVELIWGDDPPATWPNLVHTYVARVRKALGRQEIVTTGGGYRLEADEDQLDLLRFDAEVARGEAAEDPVAAERHYRAALEVWRGPVLAGEDRFRQHPVCRAVAGRRLAAVLAYADIALSLGKYEEAAEQLRAITAEEPLHEGAHARLMLALAGAGQQVAALRLFDDMRRGLATELGIEPGTELQEAQLRVLRRSVRSGPKRPAQLPGDVAGFTGRAEHVAELDRLLVDDGQAVRIAVVSGTAGVGKTALAVHWAHRVRERFPDGQLYLDLRGYGPERPVEPGDALSGFLRALGVDGADIPAEPDERAAKFRTVLNGLKVLLVLDNAGSVHQIRPLLPGTPTCSVVVTSRDTLPGLVARHGARRVGVDLLEPDEGLGLLKTLVDDRVDAEPRAARELVDYCVRLPLAVRLVAELAISRPGARLEALAAELADERRRLDLLDGGGDPQTAVRAVFSWSYRHLPADAARVFRLWGLHPGRDFSTPATAALAGVAVDEASRLTDLLVRTHLVQQTVPGRFQLHDLLRVYAGELAAEWAVDGREALSRLCDYYVYAASRAVDVVVPQEKHLRPNIPLPENKIVDWPDRATAHAWLEAERANLLAVAGTGTGYLRQLSGILWHYLDVGGYHEDALELHTHASAIAQETGDRASEVDSLTLLGLGYWRVGRCREALRHLEQALAIARETGNVHRESYVLNTLGLVCRGLGRFGDALLYLRRALELARESGDRTSEGLVLVVLGCGCRGMGLFDEAVTHLERALQLALEMGDKTSEGYARVNLGDVLGALGRREEAIQLLEEGIEHFRETGTHTSVGYARGMLGDIYRALGHYDTALTQLDEALKIARETGGRVNESVALKNIGDVYRDQGRFDEALEHLEDALAITKETGDRGVETRVLNSFGALAQARGEPAEAAGHYREALAIAIETGCRSERAIAYAGLKSPEYVEMRG
ncbi:DNA-binding transcriptional activator of the SARP family [Amycolatopsis xylanica]|uniref:DNA-binding transcriptional activator of the SARP family n=1 Tax=Amycolatopsis xylanica TaxID=589385 RepID=A0A1H3D8S4_9PSEU|nr:tetratricopeptide repeat protein [Amycolatopsis xylanica]SDX62922.1 DNA-binding transcriptional activator of the SARP family [Amycolatopsis xylanica]